MVEVAFTRIFTFNNGISRSSFYERVFGNILFYYWLKVIALFLKCFFMIFKLIGLPYLMCGCYVRPISFKSDERCLDHYKVYL